LIDVDVETPFMPYLSEVNITASARNGKTSNELGASNKQLRNNDNSSKAAIPKFSKMLKNNNKVKTRKQTDSEHLHFLHFVNIKN
jgi:hypothetical protein